MERPPPHARLTIRRRLPHAPSTAYAWLTDFDERDAERADRHVIGGRRVAKREGNRLVLEGELEIAGRMIPGHADVDLSPPDRWHAKLWNKRGKLVTFNDYRVEPDGNGGTLLTVDYHFVLPKLKHRIRYHLGGKRVLRRELGAMWDSFAVAMAREVGQPSTVTSASSVKG